MRMAPDQRLTFQCTGRSNVAAEAMSWEDDTMRITVLTVQDCPNGPVVQERITTALAGRDVEVELIEISEQADAERAGMTGSPTVLFDGIDPFVQASAVPSVSCRVYRDAGGQADGAPSVDGLRRALAAAALPEAADDDCCADALDVVGRGGRGRLAPVEGGLRTCIRRCCGTSPPPAARPSRPSWNRSRKPSARRHPRCWPSWPARTF